MTNADAGGRLIRPRREQSPAARAPARLAAIVGSALIRWTLCREDEGMQGFGQRENVQSSAN